MFILSDSYGNVVWKQENKETSWSGMLAQIILCKQDLHIFSEGK